MRIIHPFPLMSKGNTEYLHTKIEYAKYLQNLQRKQNIDSLGNYLHNVFPGEIHFLKPGEYLFLK